jgi:transposase
MKRTAHDKYIVKLTDEAYQKVQQIIQKGMSHARVITRARIVLAAHAGKKDEEICAALQVVRSTVHDTRKHYHEGGIQRALYELPRTGQPRKLNGKQEAKVVAIACTKAPKGYDHWTMDLLTEEVHTQGMAIGRTAVWKILLRNDTKPWRKKNVVYSEDYSRI